MGPFDQENEATIPDSPHLPGEGTENIEDEAQILADQDETSLVAPVDEFGLDNAEFANGEIDLKEQMDRSTANMNKKIHRKSDDSITPHSPEGQVDTTAALQEAMSSRNDKH